jgi:hypothetical protein
MKSFGGRLAATLFGVVAFVMVLSVLPSSAFGGLTLQCGKFYCNSVTQGCCYGQCYNIFTQQCVNGKIEKLPLKPRPVLPAAREPKPTRTTAPTPTLGPNCNGVPINPAVELCCGKFICNSLTQGCCDGLCYNSLTRECVNNKIQKLPLRGRAPRVPTATPKVKVMPTPKPTATMGPNCNGTEINPATQMCCGKFICNSLTQGCCNGLCYNKLVKECLSGQIQNLPLKPRPTPAAVEPPPPAPTSTPRPTATPTFTPIPVPDCPVYNTLVRGCCGGTVVPYSTTRAGCCNGIIYDLYKYSCSNGGLLRR